MGYERFEHEVARINDVLCAVNLLNWDARTQMPVGGAAARGRQIATLTGLARTLATGPAMRAAIADAQDALAGTPDDDPRRRAVDAAASAIDVLSRIPEALVLEAATLKTVAQAAWVEVRARNDFPSFAPVLRQTVALQRRIAEAIGYDAHPYDALVGQYEPGMTRARLQALYGTLVAGLKPILDDVMGRPEPRTDFLAGGFPLDGQRRFARSIAARLGFDFARGRMDDTVHPFEISFTRDDVRITGRFREDWLPAGFFGIWHEAGHGIYEQGVDPALGRSIFATDIVNLYAVGGASFGTHESQSRLYENRVGRSRRFWQLHFGALRAIFPERLGGIDADTMWRAVNRVRPSLIRVEADELTYDFHIILRSELEPALIDGTLAVDDLPAAWAEGMTRLLGVAVPDDTRGVLQDVHWSSGMIGSFPTYTIGNVMAAQFFAAAEADPAVAAGLEAGDYAPLRRWLGRAVHCHGRSRTPEELLAGATGRTLDPGPYLACLREKFASLA